MFDESIWLQFFLPLSPEAILENSHNPFPLSLLIKTLVYLFVLEACPFFGSSTD